MRHTLSARERVARGKQKLTLEQRFGDEARFIRAWLDNPLVAGAVSPSGKILCRTMARAVNPDVSGPVVELGPGTGPVTEALIRRGIPQERLILVEFDPDFCKLLARRYPRACIVEGDAYALADTLDSVLDMKAAAFVSSLPLLTKPEKHRLTLLQEAFALMRPDGVFVQFTYGVTSPVPRLDGDFRPSGFRGTASPPIWLNLPPARVWTYRTADASPYDPSDETRLDLRLKLKVGADKFGDEWRETRQRLRREFLIRAEKAKVGLKTRTEKLKSGIERHNALCEEGSLKGPGRRAEPIKSDKKTLPW